MMADPVRTYNQQQADGTWVKVTEYDDGTYSADPIAEGGYGRAGIPLATNQSVASGIYKSDIERQIAAMNDQTRRYLAQYDRETQLQLAQLNLKYQYDRLHLLDIPAMQQLDARARHQMAQDAAISYAELSGWIPAGFEDKFINAVKTVTNVSAEQSGLAAPQMTTEDMTNIKQQLQSAGWGGGSDDDAIKAFMQVAGNDPNQQDLVGRLRGGTGVQAAPTAATATTQPGATAGGMPSAPAVGGIQPQPLGPAGTISGPNGATDIGTAGPSPTGNAQIQPFQPGALANAPWVNAAGRRPTMAGAELLANPRTLGENLDVLGMGSNPGTGAQTAANLPNLQAGQQPTLAMQRMQGDPSKIAQSLISGGWSPERAAQFLQGTKLYNQIGSQVAGGNTAATAASGSPFKFFQGKQMPVADMLKWLRTGDPRAQAAQGLASFSGQDPNRFMSSFFDYLPKGGAAGPTRMV